MYKSTARRYQSLLRTGATAVEFSVAAVVLFLLIFACIEFARVAILRQVIDNVAYEACRKVIVPGAHSAEAIAYVNEVLARYRVTGVKVTITPDPITEGTGSITVQVSAPAGANQWGIARFTDGLTLRSTTTLLTERPPTIQAAAVPSPPPPPPPQEPPPSSSDPPPPPQGTPSPPPSTPPPPPPFL